ncbi:hypothetical protein RB594_003364 [Gaeumannomyces avenae]
MVSSRGPPPTYHVVPRFDIAAKGGALELGTVVDDLLMLRPLNREEIVTIPKKLSYAPVRHGGFSETHSRLREGHGGVWAKVLALQGPGLSAETSAQHETRHTLTCDDVITTYFDPDPAYVAESLAVLGVREYFAGSGYKDDVYMITGIKVAKNLRYDSSTSTQRAANAEAATREPNSGTQLGAKAGASANDERKVEFEVDDIVVGFRVRRYSYVPASRIPLSKEKKLKGEDYLVNAKMHEESKKEIKRPEATYKEVPIKEEEEAHRQAERDGQLDECWVDPTK